MMDCYIIVEQLRLEEVTRFDVRKRLILLDQFVDSLEERVFYRMVSGNKYPSQCEVLSGMYREFNTTLPCDSGETIGQFLNTHGITQLSMADGSTGLHSSSDISAVIFPIF